MGIPDLASILKDGSGQGKICQFLQVSCAWGQVPAQEPDGAVGPSSDGVDVGIPFQLVIEKDDKVFGGGDLLKYLVTDDVKALQGMLWAGDPEKLALGGIEGHAPVVSPVLQMLQVFLQD